MNRPDLPELTQYEVEQLIMAFLNGRHPVPATEEEILVIVRCAKETLVNMTLMKIVLQGDVYPYVEESGRLIFGGVEAAEESKNGRSREQSESAVIAAGPGAPEGQSW